MGCCGEKRTAQIVTASQQPRAGDAATSAAPGGVIEIHYLDTVPITVRGPATGHPYHFPGRSVQAVDARDAEALLQTGIFRRG